MNIQQSLEVETNLSLQSNKPDKGLSNNLKASKNTITDLNLVGDSILPPGRRIHLRHQTGNQAATASQLGARIRGKHHPGQNSNFFFFNCSEMSLAETTDMVGSQAVGERTRRCTQTHPIRVAAPRKTATWCTGWSFARRPKRAQASQGEVLTSHTTAGGC